MGCVMNELTGLVLVFAATTVVTLALLALFRDRDDDHLSPEPARRWFGAFTPAVAGMIPATEQSRKDIQQELYMAGYYQPAALDNFLSLRSVLTWTPIFAGLILAWLGPVEVFWWALGLGFGLGLIGYALPRIVLNSQGNQRAERIREGLPVLMDTMGLCLSTGGSVPESLDRSGEAIKRGYPDLSQEVRIVHRQSRLRSLEHALSQWKRRIPLPELSSFVFLLSQGERLGTDVTRGLWELSESYRISSRQNAEASANRMNFYLLFPTIFCLLMAATIILVAPVGLQLAKDGATLQDELIKSKEAAEKANEDSIKMLNDVQSSSGSGGMKVVPLPPAPRPTPPAIPGIPARPQL